MIANIQIPLLLDHARRGLHQKQQQFDGHPVDLACFDVVAFLLPGGQLAEEALDCLVPTADFPLPDKLTLVLFAGTFIGGIFTFEAATGYEGAPLNGLSRQLHLLIILFYSMLIYKD